MISVMMNGGPSFPFGQLGGAEKASASPNALQLQQQQQAVAAQQQQVQQQLKTDAYGRSPAAFWGMPQTTVVAADATSSAASSSTTGASSSAGGATVASIGYNYPNYEWNKAAKGFLTPPSSFDVAAAAQVNPMCQAAAANAGSMELYGHGAPAGFHHPAAAAAHSWPYAGYHHQHQAYGPFGPAAYHHGAVPDMSGHLGGEQRDNFLNQMCPRTL